MQNLRPTEVRYRTSKKTCSILELREATPRKEKKVLKRCKSQICKMIKIEGFLCIRFLTDHFLLPAMKETIFSSLHYSRAHNNNNT